MKRRYKPESKRGGGRDTAFQKPEPRFPERYLAQLRDAGLFVTEAVYDLVALKPRTVPGNSLSDYEDGPPEMPARYAEPSIPPSDAPHIYFGRWWVDDHTGFGRRREYGTPAEVVADLLDFYFGDPTRMQEWARLQTPEGQEEAYDAKYARNPKGDLCCVHGCREHRNGLSVHCLRHTKPRWWVRYKL